MYKSKKRKSINRKIIVIVAIVLVVLGLSVSVYMSRSSFLGEGVLKDIFMTIDKVVMYPFTALNSEKGNDQTESYLIQKNVNTSLEEEIQERCDQRSNADLRKCDISEKIYRGGNYEQYRKSENESYHPLGLSGPGCHQGR